MSNNRLFRRDTLWTRAIGRLLQHANTAPTWRWRFYNLKRRLLKTYGLPDSQFPGGRAVDWQDCSRLCWSCEGTGGLHEPGGCYKCGGSGIYQPVYVPLYRWRIGGYLFHLPGESVSTKPVGGCEIKGRIQHSRSRWAWHAELLLGLMFDSELAVECARYTRLVRMIRNATARVCRLVPRRCRSCGCLFTPDRCDRECNRCDLEGIPF